MTLPIHAPAFYNEIEPYLCAWLNNQIAAGLVPPGHVDVRDIRELEANDLDGYRQVHLFAGVGGWAYAARLAGWPDDAELWTASCPCQPFSLAGKRTGTDDPRHLWPDVFRLVRARRPAVLVGEQVTAAVGQHWLDRVFSDLETLDYACRAVVLPACAVNAPHRRDRLWFVAHTYDARLQGHVGDVAGAAVRRRIEDGLPAQTGVRDGARIVGDADCFGGQVDPHADRRAPGSGAWPVARSGRASAGTVADADKPCAAEGWVQRRGEFGGAGGDPRDRDVDTGGAWDDHGWITGYDGRLRRVPRSGIRLLAHGIPARIPRLRAAGNAIVPQIAAEVLSALWEGQMMRTDSPTPQRAAPAP